MKRGFPFQAKPPEKAQQIEVNIALDQENIRNCFVVGRMLGKEPTEIANTIMRIGFLRVQLKRLEEGFVMEVIAKEAMRAAEAAAPEEKPKGEEDTSTAEERLKEARKLAGLE